MENVDLEIPLLFIKLKNKKYLVDGFHRLAVAKDKEVKELPFLIVNYGDYLKFEKNHDNRR